ncbi:MAG: hypothetical protein H0W40_01285 [Methylibium sp.]|uniref:hypothetical protein n=1 Tax=Methylibium sp. TaxID=2067992 RepID=UPI0017FD7113|nr:hypothetical protein [Methylibium sp.]MBA3596004.1 hypothetical protein [Methylibium sp.]
MSSNIVILIIIVAAAVAFFMWMKRGKSDDMSAGAPAYKPPAAAPATAPGATLRTGGPLASYDEYRRVSPSNMINGKLTCNQCGSNLVRTDGGTASCTTCGASLYRA